jgi:hypothetical protein
MAPPAARAGEDILRKLFYLPENFSRGARRPLAFNRFSGVTRNLKNKSSYSLSLIPILLFFFVSLKRKKKKREILITPSRSYGITM